jgi:hypothetical protein
MYLIFGACSLLLTVLIEFILLQFHLQLHNVIFEFCIPIGSLIEGAICVSGVFAYLRIKHIRVRTKHFVFAILTAFITFALIHSVIYLAAYISNEQITYGFIGSYTLFKVTTAEYRDIVIKVLSSIQNHGLGFNIYLFFVEIAGFLIGGGLIGFIALDNMEFCKKCKKLLTSKNLYIFQKENVLKEIEEFEKSLESKWLLDMFLDRQRFDIEEGKPYYKVTLKYCHKCRKAYIVYYYLELKQIKKSEKNEWVSNSKKYKEFNITPQMLETILSKS